MSLGRNEDSLILTNKHQAEYTANIQTQTYHHNYNYYDYDYYYTCFGSGLQDKFETAKSGTDVESTICRLHNNCVSSLQ